MRSNAGNGHEGLALHAIGRFRVEGELENSETELTNSKSRIIQGNGGPNGRVKSNQRSDFGKPLDSVEYNFVTPLEIQPGQTTTTEIHTEPVEVCGGLTLWSQVHTFYHQ